MSGIVLSLPVRTQSLANMREHWRRRHKRTQFERLHTRAAWLKGRFRPLAPGETARVHLVRIGPQLLDSDNLPPSMKSIRDELADCMGFGKDDRNARVEWTYAQERGKYAVRVEITVYAKGAA